MPNTPASDEVSHSALTEVGALIINNEGRVFVQRRSRSRRLFPGAWDIVGGAVETRETATEALSREIFEETGWELTEVLHAFSPRKWSHNSEVHVEANFIVRVNGDLTNPHLESDKHDDYRWITFDSLEILEVSAETTGSNFILNIVSDSLEWLALNKYPMST